jgi:oligosaccharide reducing-end xylanase
MTPEKRGAYHTNQYRNVFQEVGYDESLVMKRLQDTWEQLFYGDEDTKIYYELDDDKAYILDTGNLDVRTEGLSYGMMMCVQMNRKEEFDKLWRFAKTFMQHQEGRYKHYFAWHARPDGTRISQGPAPDGEEYFAMALLFAASRWGDGQAPLNYSEQARQILRACLHQGENGNGGHPMWDPETKLIKFIPESPFSDPSYHLPHFYELFALWADPEDRLFWKQAAEASREYLPKACHPVTGLAPEYANYDGSPRLDIPDHRDFYSDSYRVAANIGLDCEWFGRDERLVSIANRIQAFFADIDPADYRKYAIDGTAFDEPALHPVGLLATNAMVALAAEGEHAAALVERFWNTPLRTGPRRYYDNCLYFFSMLALSGQYRIWC